MKLEWHTNTKDGLTWQEAMDYCQELGDDWRLPTIEELILPLIFPCSVTSCATNNSTKHNFTAAYYWSSTAYARNNDYAWLVYVHSGYVNYCLKSSTSYARAVREVKI